MSGQEDVSSQPLVIVRRRRNTEEAHHGGVWKIAYADFMTAMMAFFLVMWLVNAADKKTIVQVAAYFNPVRLTDRTITSKGLEEMTEDAKSADKDAKKGHQSKVKNDDKEKHEAASDGPDALGQSESAAAEKSEQTQKEQALFDNPSDTLDKLADQAKSDQSAPAADQSASDAVDSDPFDRQNRTFRKRSGSAKADQKSVKSVDASKSEPVKSSPESPAKPNEGKANTLPAPEAIKGVVTPPPTVNDANKDDKLNDKKNDKKEDKVADKVDTAEKVETELSSAISKVAHKLPHVDVKATAEGLLISLTDDANFGMFEVGSAKPRPELVLVMAKVGEFLRTTPGKIVVRGHTDSRAYKSGNYDNWRLSAARAQMAYYMLVRGGVPESDFVAVEGRADRDPKIPTDTEAAQNRRIDILIRNSTP